MGEADGSVHAGSGDATLSGATGMGRRHFLALATCGCGVGSRSLCEADKPVDIGAVSDYPMDGIAGT